MNNDVPLTRAMEVARHHPHVRVDGEPTGRIVGVHAQSEYGRIIYFVRFGPGWYEALTADRLESFNPNEEETDG